MTVKTASSPPSELFPTVTLKSPGSTIKRFSWFQKPKCPGVSVNSTRRFSPGLKCNSLEAFQLLQWTRHARGDNVADIKLHDFITGASANVLDLCAHLHLAALANGRGALSPRAESREAE